MNTVCDDDNSRFDFFLDWLCGERPAVNNNRDSGSLDLFALNDGFYKFKNLANPSGMPVPFGSETTDMLDIIAGFDPDGLIDLSSNLGEDGYTRGLDDFKSPELTPCAFQDPSVNWGHHSHDVVMFGLGAGIARSNWDN